MTREFSNLTVDDVRTIINTKHEKEFLLVDVRQPEEYRKMHIPGAVLVPLGHFKSQLENLPRDKELIFYCHSGRRSAAAAVLAGSSGLFTPDTVFNMKGGIIAWEGLRLQGAPDLKSFDFSGSMTENILQAMELEKGAERFYLQILDVIEESEVKDRVTVLAKAEEAHARKLYGAIPVKEGDFEDFDTLYQQLRGDVVEGGKGIELLLAFLDDSGMSPCRASIELALTIECTAYDMYRNLAEYCIDAELEALFLEIAQSEKAHITLAAEALAMCPQ